MKDLKKLKQRRKEAAGLCLRRWKNKRDGKLRRRGETMKNMVSFLTVRILLKKAKMIMILVMTTKLEVRWMT